MKILERIFKHEAREDSIDLFDAEDGELLGGAILDGEEVKFNGDIPEEMKRTLGSMLRKHNAPTPP